MCFAPALAASPLEQQKESCQLLKAVLLYNAVNLTYASLRDLTQVSQWSILFSTDSFIRFLLKRSFHKVGCSLSLGLKRTNIWIKNLCGRWTLVTQNISGFRSASRRQVSSMLICCWLSDFLKTVNSGILVLPLGYFTRSEENEVRGQTPGMYSSYFLFISKELCSY